MRLDTILYYLNELKNYAIQKSKVQALTSVLGYVELKELKVMEISFIEREIP